MDGKCVTIDPVALEALLAPWNRSDAPGIVAGVAHPEAGTWKAGYGLASLELPLVNTTRTRMRIGSVSKMFTCLAVMLLAEEGSVDIDAPARLHLPELPDWGDGMTLRQFMNHTSGMRCHLDLLLQTGGWARPAPATALATLCRQQGVNFPPGERWSYNNGGYNLLSLIVERVSGDSFEAFLERRIFAPIGMRDTAVKRSDSQMFPNSASLHVSRADGSFRRGFFGMQIAGEGAMVSTVEDMLLWLGHLRTPFVGSTATWREMTKPALLTSGRTTGYGLGINVADYRGLNVWHHAGGVPGGACMCLTLPEISLDVILVANRGDAPVQTLAFDIVDACVEGLAAQPTAFVAPPINGLFRDADSGNLLRLEDREGNQIVSLAGIEVPVQRTGDRRIEGIHPLLELEIELQRDGCATLDMRGSTDRFQPAERNGDPGRSGQIAGVFTCDEVECVATFAQAGDGLTLRLDGPYGRDLYRLEQVCPDLWVSQCLSEPESGLGGVLEMNDDASRFTLTTARTRRLPFVRVAADAPAALAARTLGAGTV